ncbi:MAG: recombination protein RecR [Rhodospirillales bacterium]|nr:recombination protein RecR [Rhodospirillales bacterium]
MLDIERLIQMLARLPGLGPRSARRVALHLLKRKDATLAPLIQALTEAAANVRTCGACGNLDTADPCGICADAKRDGSVLCVVEDVADLWAMERAGAFRGRYHVLGGALSALDGVGPEELRIPKLIERVVAGKIAEVILATNATVEGQITAHYIAERLAGSGARVSGLAQGIPVGGELDYLDDGTLSAALKSRRPM